MDKHTYIVNVDVAVTDGDMYLFIERSSDKDHAAGQLAFPGGRVEQSPGGKDTIEATATRELREEVGLDATAVEYVLSSTFEDDRGTRCLNIVTLCEEWSGTPSVNAPAEVSSLQWLSADTVPDHSDIQPFLVEYVERIETVREP